MTKPDARRTVLVALALVAIVGMAWFASAHTEGRLEERFEAAMERIIDTRFAGCDATDEIGFFEDRVDPDMGHIRATWAIEKYARETERVCGAAR